MTKLTSLNQEISGDESQGFITTNGITKAWFTQTFNTSGSVFLRGRSFEKQKEVIVNLPSVVTDNIQTPLLDIQFDVVDVPNAMNESATYEKVTDTQYRVWVSYTRPNNKDSDFNMKVRARGKTV